MTDRVVQGRKTGLRVRLQMQFGGYVALEMGRAVDGRDSYAAEVAPASHWQDMKSVNPATPAVKKVVCFTACMQAIA